MVLLRCYFKSKALPKQSVCAQQAVKRFVEAVTASLSHRTELLLSLKCYAFYLNHSLASWLWHYIEAAGISNGSIFVIIVQKQDMS